MNSTTPDQAGDAPQAEPGCGQAAGPQPGSGGNADGEAGRQSATEATSRTGHEGLYRPADDRMIAGVAAGLARFLGVDVLLARIVIVVLCFVGGVGLPLYLASWLLIPEEGAEQSIAADFFSSMQSWRI